MTNQRFITILGYVATFTSVCMYVSYLQQIGLNLSGQKGGWLQPFATMINCGPLYTSPSPRDRQKPRMPPSA